MHLQQIAGICLVDVASPPPARSPLPRRSGSRTPGRSSGGHARRRGRRDRVDLPKGLIRLSRRASEEIAAGHDVTMLRSDEVLTPNEAAELLSVSRQYLFRLLDDGVIASDTLPASAHRRLLLADVLAFQAERDRRRASVEAFRRCRGRRSDLTDT